MYNFQHFSVLYNNTNGPDVCEICILLTCKPLHDRIISLRGDAWVYQTNLQPPRFIEVSVPSQESVWSCICVLEVSILPLSVILMSRQYGIYLFFILLINICFFQTTQL